MHNEYAREEVRSLDVVMCTWNSNKSWFKKCLESIKREIPFHHIVIVDRFSVDGTLDVVKEVFPSAVIAQSAEHLARARALGITLVDTDWFLFIDSDVEIPKGWFKNILSNLGEGIAVVHGYALAVSRSSRKWNEFIYSFSRVPKLIDVDSSNPDRVRGLLDATLLLRSAVEDWNPPSYLPGFEDHHMLRHVVNKGYEWRMLPRLYVNHHVGFIPRLKRARWDSACARLIKFPNHNLKTLLKRTLVGLPLAIFGALKMGEPMIIPNILFNRLFSLIGYVGWTKYALLRR